MSKPRTGPPEAAMRSAEEARAMSGVLKGWVVGRSFGDEYHATVAMEGADLRKLTLGQEILLVPDDGSHKVVTVEEWEAMERDHQAMERLRAGFMDGWEWLYDGQDLAMWPIPADEPPGHHDLDPADAILATEGGDKP